MARKSNKNRPRREVKTPSLALLSGPSPSYKLLTQIEDRREYHPLGSDRPARSLDGSPSTITVADRASRSVLKRGSKWGSKIASQTKAKLLFSEPHRPNQPNPTLVCVRRSQRKEVLHALKKTGGRGARRKPRRNWTSAISCK